MQIDMSSAAVDVKARAAAAAALCLAKYTLARRMMNVDAGASMQDNTCGGGGGGDDDDDDE